MVLDLDETLIHYDEDDEQGKVHFRPHLDEFLGQLRNYFEIIIFTASLQEYADSILDHMDPEKTTFIKRYYRQHTIEGMSNNIKDLSILRLDLSKVIIIDNTPENFVKHKSNGIFIKSWFNDAEDTCLKDLIPFLKNVVINQVADVREYLEGYRSEMIEKIKKGSIHPGIEI